MTDVTDIGQSVPIGSPMDPMDHPVDSGHNSGFNPGRVKDKNDNKGQGPTRDNEARMVAQKMWQN